MEVMLDIPYRCPRCGGARTFNTLSELKLHMAEEHAYCAQKRQRLRIFDYTPQHRFMGTGRHSPLLQSFFDEGERLEEEVKAAKREEHNNKLRRQKQQTASSPSAKSVPPSNSQTAHSKGAQRKPKVNFRYPLHDETDTYLQDTVNQLNQDVIAQRQEQFRTADALYTTQDVLSGVEEAAEGRVSEQQNFIAELNHQLVEKEQQLLELRTELQRVKDRENEKAERDWGQSVNANSTDRERGRIEDDLLKKKTEVEMLNRQLASARQSENRQLASARQSDNRDKVEAPSERRQETAVEKNLERTKPDLHNRVPSDSHSGNPDISEDSRTQPSVTVSRISSSSNKDQNHAVQPEKQYQMNRNSRIPQNSHQSYTSPPEWHHHSDTSDSEGSWTRPSVTVSRNSSSKAQDRTSIVKQQKQNRPDRSPGTSHNIRQSQVLLPEKDKANGSVLDASWTQPSVTVNRKSSSTPKDQASWTQPSLTVNRKSSLTPKDQSNAARQQKQSRKNQNFGAPRNAQQSSPFTSERHPTIHNQLRQDNHPQPPNHPDRKPANNQKLKEERSHVVEQMKDLLCKATTDNEKLKDELMEKENQLQLLNQELERTKTDQSDLMEETYDLYREAEKSLDELKERLKSKEQLLEQANDRLDEIRHEQERLSMEKATVARHSDDKDLLYQNMMRDRDEQIESLNNLLVSQQEERKRLKDIAGRLKEEVQEKEQAQQELSQAIADKEQELAKAKDDVSTLFTFLQTAAAKESEARCKLEGFVTELIDRADRAERELQHLRRLESSISGNLTSDPSLIGAVPPAAGVGNLSSIPGHSTFNQGTGPLNSTPLPGQEPWYNNLSMSNAPGSLQRQPATGLHPASSTPIMQQAPVSQVTLLPGVGYVSMPLQNLSHPAENVAYPASQQLCAQQTPPVQQTHHLPSHHPLPPGKTGNTRPASRFHGNAVPGDESLVYAALPKVSSGGYGPAGSSKPAPYVRQSSAYDGGDEQQFLSDLAGGVPGGGEEGVEKNHRFVVNSSGKVLHNNAASKAEQGSPSARRKGTSQASGSGVRGSRRMEDMLDGRTFERESKQQSSAPISPDRTYPIYSVTGKNAPEVRSSDLSDSTYSYQDTPHFHKAIVDRKPRLKGKGRLGGGSLNKYPGKLYRYIDDSSTDGIELSVDENGIMWEPLESFFEVSESYRMSPYGSETAGDVDTSVLLSSRSHGNKRVLKGGQDTDEDIDSLDDDGVLRPVRDRRKTDDRKVLAERKKASELPLGERINRVLKSVGEDESESLELLMMHGHEDAGRRGAGSRPARGRAPRPEVDSPLERALAVQDRLKSLTYPGTQKKLVKIVTSTSDTLPNRRSPSPYSSRAQPPMPTPRQHYGPGCARSYPVSTAEEPGLAVLEDFSSSSYASLSHIPVSNGASRMAAPLRQQPPAADDKAGNRSVNSGLKPQVSPRSSRQDVGLVQVPESMKESMSSASRLADADAEGRELRHHGQSGMAAGRNNFSPEEMQNVIQQNDRSSSGKEVQYSNPSRKDVNRNNPAERDYQTSNDPAGRDYQTSNDPARRDYQTSNDPAGRSYQTSNHPAGRDYQTSNHPAGRDYKSSNDPARRDYQTSSDPARRDYQTSNHPAGRDYQTSNHPAGRDYQTSNDLAGRDYQTSNDPARRDYQTSNDPARRDYQIGNDPARRDYQTSNDPGGRDRQTSNDPARRDYQISNDLARRDYQTSNDPAGRDYQTSNDPARRDDQISNDPARRDYQTSNDLAGRDYQTSHNSAGKDFQTNNYRTGSDIQDGNPSEKDFHSSNPAGKDFQSGHPAGRDQFHPRNDPAERDSHPRSIPSGREIPDRAVPSEGVIRQKSNPVTRQSSLARQTSVSMESLDEDKEDRSAQRPRVLPSLSESSQQSSEVESVAHTPPPALPPPQAVKTDNDSTDFDFDMESDLDKYAGAAGGEGRRGTLAGKTGLRKTAHRKPKGKPPGGGKPKPEDSTGSSTSDIETAQKNKRREDARRRRVALFRVFSYLDARNLCKMALVCREWRRVSRHPRLWLNVHLKYERISSQFLVTMSSWCNQMTSLTLEGLRAGSRRQSETLDEYNRRTKGCLEAGLEELLKASQDSLKCLSITACSNILTDKCMWLVSGYCRLLQRLTYLSDTHPLTAEVMWALGGGCPSITSLIIPPLFPCHNSEGMTNRCMMLIAQFYPDLLEVGVGGRSLDITGLVPLVQSCQRLLSLNVDHIKEMKDDSATALCRAGLRQLQQLELSGTPVTAGALNTFYNSCHHLKQIRVFICINDYFEDVRKKKNKEEYKKVVKSLEELKKQVGLGNILVLRAAPAE